jgi:hypothetical protein
MNPISKSREFVRGEAFDPADDTMLNGVPYDARLAVQDSLIQGPPEASTAPDDHTAEEIKRRKVLLTLRYIMAGHAR